MPEIRGFEGGDAVDLLRELVRTPSVNPQLEADGAGEADIARLTARWLSGWGFEVEWREPEPGRPSVLARHGSGGPTLLLNGHLDTVGVAGMTVAPFDAYEADGRLHGRGACDMKAGVAALLAAARDLVRRGHRGTLVVALTADEEHASLGMADCVAAGLRADAAVVCEPTSLAVMPAHKGFVWIDAEVRGRAAHGSRPEVGIDAIRNAARYLVALDALDEALRADEPHPLLGHGSWHAGTITGGAAASVYPERCSVSLERRTLPGETAADVVSEFRAVAADLRVRAPDSDVRIEVSLERPGTEVSSDHPLVTGLLEAARAEGVDPRVEAMTAWVDAAFLNEAGTPAVCFGPGSIEQAHSADEWVETREVTRCAAILERFAAAFLET
ncbi:MAG: ArgE/DapE family deacylase [Gemmatimonadetes bacterium]|nr:ArgE/DapE family deacylase [Gemmatimonadota bacterium]